MLLSLYWNNSDPIDFYLVYPKILCGPFPNIFIMYLLPIENNEILQQTTIKGNIHALTFAC